MVQAFLQKWWVESDFKAPNLPLSLRLNGSSCHYNSIYSGPACVSNVRVIELSEQMGIIWWITATFNVKTCHTVTLQSIAYNCAAHSVLGNINDFITIVNFVNNNSLTRGLNRRWNGRPHRCKQWQQLWNFKYQFLA